MLQKRCKDHNAEMWVLYIMVLCLFNSLAPGKSGWNFRYIIFKQILLINVISISLWICAQVKAKGLHWWSVNTGSGNGLVPSGSKPLPEAMLPRPMLPYDVTRP